MEAVKSYEILLAEIEELKSQLEESHDTIEAIRTGEIDAFIIKNDNGHQLYTLKSADQTYRIFIEKMAEGAVTINEKGVILYCNTSFTNIINVPLKQLLGFNFNDFIPEEYHVELKELLQQAWVEERKTEIILPGKNKAAIPVMLYINSLEIGGGRALSIIVSDLSYQKETERKLKEKNVELMQAQSITKRLNEQLEETVKERTNELFESREHFKFLTDNIPTIVWIAKPNGKIDFFNKRWFEYTGNNNMPGNEEMHSFIHPNDKEAYLNLWKNSINSSKAFESVHRFKKASGDYGWHFSQALPFKNNRSEILAWFGISTDIDDQQKALEKKDEFISIASHELKTPVTSIKGYVQLLRFNFQKEGNLAAADLLSKVDTQINKLSSLIGDLLDARKIENGQLHFQEEVFDFNELAKEITEETERTLEDHRVICHFDTTHSIKADRNKIGQVISNFMVNAGKYSPGGTDIYVKTCGEGNRIKLSVQDFGIGIPKEQQAKIFERFFRVNEEKENTYAGLGLGLYISSEIIKHYKGKIGVESIKGTGSTFYFELPIADQTNQYE